MPSFKEKVTIEDVFCIRDHKVVDGKRIHLNAILCVIDGEEVWIPQSHIDDDSEVWREGDEGMLVVSEWIASQKGLI